MIICVFFFFQAEDGIRDIGVTGVQTCALPIFRIGYLFSVEPLIILVLDTGLGGEGRRHCVDFVAHLESRPGRSGGFFSCWARISVSALRMRSACSSNFDVSAVSGATGSALGL